MRQQLLTLDQLVQLMDPELYLHLQSAESTNFFFFFRMLLVWYKREFEWVDVLRLWESLWTDWLSSEFHLFVTLAILEKHRDVIMAHLKHFDEILKYSKWIFGAAYTSLLQSLTNGFLTSKRTLQYNRPHPHSLQSRGPIQPLHKESRGHRQEIQFPCCTGSPT
jgi:hypothetical protein